MRSHSIALVIICALPAICYAAEGRIPISAQTTIASSGSHIVTEDFTVNSGAAITINEDHVTVDLDGHTIGSSVLSADVVVNANNHKDITLKNGKVVGGIHFISPGGEFHVEGIHENCSNSSQGIQIEGTSATTSTSNIYANNHTLQNGANGCGTCGICGVAGNVPGGGNVDAP